MRWDGWMERMDGLDGMDWMEWIGWIGWIGSIHSMRRVCPGRGSEWWHDSRLRQGAGETRRHLNSGDVREECAQIVLGCHGLVQSLSPASSHGICPLQYGRGGGNGEWFRCVVWLGVQRKEIVVKERTVYAQRPLKNTHGERTVRKGGMEDIRSS